jgi:hypothetical protein
VSIVNDSNRCVNTLDSMALGKFAQSATQNHMRKLGTRWEKWRAVGIGSLWACLMLISASAVLAASGDDQWVPSLALSSAALPEERSGKLFNEITGFQDGESTGLPWTIAGELALASPVVGGSIFKPRFIAHVGVGYVLDSEDPVSTRDDPGNRPFVSPRQPDPLSIENQGSALRVQAKPLVLTGGLGAIFEIEAFDRTFFLRPTIEWMYRKDTIQAILGAGEGETLDVNGNCAPCRILYIDAEREKGYHSLGLGLETGIDGGRMGNFLVRFFASARAYHILGDRKSDLSPTGTWEPTDGLPTTRADPQTTISARYEREPFHYRVGVGLRFLFSPEILERR